MRNITDPTTDPSPRRPVDRRVLAVVLAVVGAACLVVAAFSKSWMGNPSFSGLVRDRDGNATAAEGRYLLLRGDIRFGPTGFERCAKPYRGFEMNEAPAEITCEGTSTESFNEIIAQLDPMNRDRYTSAVFSHAGWMAFGACLLSAAALVAAAGLVLARKQLELPVSPASVALLGLVSAMVAGCVFVATKPGPPGMLGVDLGFWAFGAGTVVGILGAQLLAKQLRPPDPDLLADAMDPAELSVFPASGREASVPVPVPLAPVPPTQPVEALVDEAPGGGPAAAPSPAELPAGAKNPEESS